MSSLAKGQPPDHLVPQTPARGKLSHASARHWSPHSRPGGTPVSNNCGPSQQQQPFSFSGVHGTKASTMDGDKRRLFLDRMKANPFFGSKSGQTGQNPAKKVQNRSTGVEIMTDDEVGTVSSEDPHGHMSLFLHHQHEQQTQHFSNFANNGQNQSKNSQPPQQQQRPKFDIKGPVYGYRSLSTGSRGVPQNSVMGSVSTLVDTAKSSSLFAGEDDPPLLMSSIDGVTTQVRFTNQLSFDRPFKKTLNVQIRD